MNRLLRQVGFSRFAGLALLTVLIAIRVADPVFVERLRLQAFDTFQQIKPRDAARAPVAIIDVDDRSLTEIGQWPWPRTLIADLVRKASGLGAVVVAFDIVFSEPDRLSPDGIARDNTGLSPDIREQLLSLPPNDAVLAEAFANARVVAGQTSVRRQLGGGGNTQSPRDVPHALVGPDPGPYMLRFAELVQNLPELENSASGWGVFTVLADPDGVYRRVPVVMSVQEKLRLSLTVEMLRVATGGNAFAIKSNEAGIDGVVVGGQLIRTETDGTVWNNYSPSAPSRFVSATDLLNDRVPQDRLAGHLVLVGTSAIGLEDFRATPLGVPMAGVEIHAQLLENILGKTLLQRPNYTIGMELAWITVLSLLVIGLAPVLPARFLVAATIAIVLGYLLFSFYLFVENKLLVDPTFPAFATVLCAMLMSSVNYIREELRRQQIRSAFGQYVAPDLVSELADNPEKLRLGGESRELTILFTDVRGFTAISESFEDDPVGLTQLMNRFLTAMSDAILEQGGTIDKYMGDAIMAFWNAPLDTPGHQRRACAAALAMLTAVESLNRQEPGRAETDRKTPPIQIGIGINTGQCVVGNMGSDKRFDYSAIGDPVNLASRLEGQTKSYASDIIVGSATADAADEEFALLELDLIRVKGKQIPERIFALLGGRELATREGFRRLSDANARMLDQYRRRDWSRALSSLDEIRVAARDAGTDITGYADIYSDRINRYRQNDPGPEWDGVFVATEK